LRKKILLVGASTGGPSQIKEILSHIESLSCTIIIVQHMREAVLPFFIKDLNDSLKKIKLQTTPLTLTLNKPSVIICSESSIIKKSSMHFEIITDKVNQRYTPDIDKLFNSFTKYTNNFEIEVLIMTGIGDDGVAGAINLKSCGAKIYAQDKKSSPVYGMPRVAYESGIVDCVKSLDEIKEYFKRL